jgi:hypothetical protein
LSLSPDVLSRHPHLLLQRLQAVPALPPPKSAEITYPTVWGNLTFEALYNRIRPYAVNVVSQYIPSDRVEDGLQIGYMRLWELLQSNPCALQEREIGWIGKFMRYSAYRNERRSATRLIDESDLELYQWENAIPLAEVSGGYSQHSHESRQSDTRHDLLTAIRDTAEHLLATTEGLTQQRCLWALYSMTALHLQVTAASELFKVRHQSMHNAYEIVRGQLQSRLKEYAPLQPTKPVRAERPRLPEQDMSAIRLANMHTPDHIYQQVRDYLCADPPPTLERDLIALAGIQAGISAKEQSRRHMITKSGMQRAYERVHLLIAAQQDDSVRPRQAPKQRMQAFEMNDEIAPVLQMVASELAAEVGNFLPVIALYAHICNLPNRAVARDFGVSEAPLRQMRYRVQGWLSQS